MKPAVIEQSLHSGATHSIPLSVGVESGIFRPILVYLVDLGDIMIVAVSSVVERVCVNGRYRTRTCDLTGVIRAL